MTVNVNAVKDIRAFFGTSGSGKSHAIKETIKPEPRVLMFDPDGEYDKSEKFEVFNNPYELAEAVEKAKTKFRFSLHTNGPDNFDMFCKIVAKKTEDGPLVAGVDELAGVERSIAKADGIWHTLLSRGRKYELKIRAGAQSPTEISKTLMRNRSHLWVGYMERGDDWAYMAKETGLSVDDFKNLRPDPWFDSIMIMRSKQPVFNKRKKPTR